MGTKIEQIGIISKFISIFSECKASNTVVSACVIDVKSLPSRVLEASKLVVDSSQQACRLQSTSLLTPVNRSADSSRQVIKDILNKNRMHHCDASDREIDVFLITQRVGRRYQEHLLCCSHPNRWSAPTACSGSVHHC